MNTIEDGAFALLDMTIEVLTSFDSLDYVVLGGWCPVLRNTSDVRHPGTLDVDILFQDAYRQGALEAVSKKFISAGFMPSAKHPFQLLFPQLISSQRFIFNIDLLHPHMMDNEDEIGMFVDHLELDVPLNNDEATLKKMASIVLPNSEILFREKLFDQYERNGKRFNLVTFEGMFVTKMDSCQKQKRERDSLDIYLAFLSGGIDAKNIIALAEKDHRIGESLSKFTDYLKTNGSTFDANVRLFCKSIGESAANHILGKLSA